MSERNFVEPEVGGIRFISAKSLADAGTTGLIVEGLYQGKSTNRFEPDKFDYKFQTEDGETVVINHNGSLSYWMNSIEPGTYCQVLYNGKQILESGKMKGREAHNFKVLVEDIGDEIA